MMGRTHATSGAVAFLALVPLAPQVGLSIAGPAVAVGALAAAGAAMLPDLDHRDATVAQSLGPVTRGLAGGVAAVSGGHRNGTHSVLGVAACTALSGAAVAAGGVWLGLLLAFLAAVALAALRVEMARATVVHTLLVLAAGVPLTLLAVYRQFSFDVVPWAVGVGAAAHVVGDMLTREGCPLLWPVSRRRFRLLRLTTDGPVERYVVGPGLGVLAVVLVWGLSAPDALGFLGRVWAQLGPI